MTPEQRELARHALGLPNDRKGSYRNRFFTGSGPNFKAWSEMVTAGDAVIDPYTLGKNKRFELTRQGAEAALEPGESLCPEDFPRGSAS